MNDILYAVGIICCCALAVMTLITPFYTADSFECSWFTCEFVKYDLVNKHQCINAEEFYKIPKGLNISMGTS